ncbi:hypothetical protein CCH79_00015484 [Gambusia affinis]|uniref:Uncharacterized protein n=1 Tax=Gambusia affinis TaxID=33528 RepID=A0A315VPD3_GAMAF|nr:hypothetical protein CCH79_00015484 [Gambusia affinis]
MGSPLASCCYVKTHSDPPFCRGSSGQRGLSWWSRSCSCWGSSRCSAHLHRSPLRMNLIENKTLRSQLHDEEAVVVENAVRLAIDSVLNVLYGVNGARTREYQRMVADRDKEIQRLEGRLTEIERELQVLRRHGCTCGLFEAGSRTSANRQTGEQIRPEAGGVGPEVTAGPQDCDLSLSFPAEHLENNEGQILREKTPVNPAGFQISAGDQLRNKKKNVPMSQLTEEAQRLKRAAWRAASKRYYARKIARQQASLHGGGGGHAASAQRGCLVEERRKRMISDLPEESQMMRREMWRAASRRYYDRKTTRHPNEGLQYGHLMENLDPAGATQGPNGEGPLVITGIMCS